MFEVRSADLSERLTVFAGREGTLRISSKVSDFVSRTTDFTSILLPAADARRLLAWLRERYPETDTGEPR